MPLIESVLNCSPKLVAEFQSAINGLAVEKRGVAHMEMFFVYTLAVTVRPQRIIESGRGRGQSTIVLARCFPNSQILSIESDAKSLDARFAQERLSAFSNVKCLFGDSRDIIPKYLMPGTVVVIDGPKEFRALKLMIKLMRTENQAWFSSTIYTPGVTNVVFSNVIFRMPSSVTIQSFCANIPFLTERMLPNRVSGTLSAVFLEASAEIIHCFASFYCCPERSPVCSLQTGS